MGDRGRSAERGAEGGLGEEFLEAIVFFEEFLDDETQHRFILAGAVEKRLPFVALEFESFSEKLLCRFVLAHH